MQILFVGHNRIGDAVLSSGVLGRLAEVRAGASFFLICGPEVAPLFSAVPGGMVYPLAKERGGRHWLRVWQRVVTCRWDLVVDFRNSILAWTVRARRRHVVPRALPNEHKVRHMARTMGWGDDPPAPRLWVTAQAEERSAALIPGGSPVLALGPTANWPGKVWPAERFVSVAQILTMLGGPMPGARIAVFGGPRERDLAQPVLDALPEGRVIDLVGRADLPTVYACMRRCNQYVGNDSGLMHMAAAAGIPTLGLFGPSRAEHYAPWGPRGAFVRTVETFDELVGQPGYDHRTTGSLMGSLDVDKVVAAAEALWQRSYGEAA